MPGGKYGGKQVFEDDLDYDDYLEDEDEEEEEEEYEEDQNDRQNGVPGLNEVANPSLEKSAHGQQSSQAQEYDEFISELLGGPESQEQPEVSFYSFGLSKNFMICMIIFIFMVASVNCIQGCAHCCSQRVPVRHDSVIHRLTTVKRLIILLWLPVITGNLPILTFTVIYTVR